MNEQRFQSDPAAVARSVKNEKRIRAISRKLKPCPLCGGKVYYEEVLFGSRLMWREIRCYECRLAMTGKIQKRLIEKWNRCVDVEPVKHGHWISRFYAPPLSDVDFIVKKQCSECLTHWDRETNYCPYCGSKMDA